jgi:hypothetical protein
LLFQIVPRRRHERRKWHLAVEVEFRGRLRVLVDLDSGGLADAAGLHFIQLHLGQKMFAQIISKGICISLIFIEELN